MAVYLYTFSVRETLFDPLLILYVYPLTKKLNKYFDYLYLSISKISGSQVSFIQVMSWD